MTVKFNGWLVKIENSSLSSISFSIQFSHLFSSNSFYSKSKLNGKRNWRWGRKIFDFDQSIVLFNGQLKKNIIWYSLEKKKILLDIFYLNFSYKVPFGKKNFITYFLTLFSCYKLINMDNNDFYLWKLAGPTFSSPDQIKPKLNFKGPYSARTIIN